MIFFFCGAPKHGSHFQLFIVCEALRQKGVDCTQVGNDIFHRRDLKRSVSLLDQIRDQEGLYVCKGHYGSKRERDLLLRYKNIKIFLIWRDLRDVLVSQYFYEMNKGGKVYRDFADFYYKKGRWFACYHTIYRKNWEKTHDDARVINSNFEQLKTRFPHAAQDILSRVGITGIDLDALENELTLEKLRHKHNDAKGVFFRKGRVNDHLEVIADEAIYADLDRISHTAPLPLALKYQTTKIPIAIEKLKAVLNSKR